MDKCPPLRSYPNKSSPPRQKLGCKSPRVRANFWCKSPGVRGGMVMDEIDTSIIITEVTAISRRQLQNSQLHSHGRASRYRRAHGIFALSSQFPLMLKTWPKKVNRVYLNKFLKDGKKCWVKQGELFFLSLLLGVPKSLLFNLRIFFILDKAYLNLDFR